MCALTPHPPHSKTLAREPALALVQGAKGVKMSGLSTSGLYYLVLLNVWTEWILQPKLRAWRIAAPSQSQCLFGAFLVAAETAEEYDFPNEQTGERPLRLRGVAFPYQRLDMEWSRSTDPRSICTALLLASQA